MSQPQALTVGRMIGSVARTLTANGFLVQSADRGPTYILFRCHRYDEFGVSVPYIVALCEPEVGLGDVQAIDYIRTRHGAGTVFVVDGPSNRVADLIEQVAPGAMRAMGWPEFMGRLGGPVRSWLVLEPMFQSTLVELGHNRAVPALTGRPDTLFEEYVHVALQFLLDDRVIRYGQARTGDPVPEGLAFVAGDPLLYYDAKAAGGGYKVDIETIRQFSDYVNSFRQRYGALLQPVRSFIVVSGSFRNSKKSLGNYSEQMLNKAGVPLNYVTSHDLGAAVTLLAKHPGLRRAVDWRMVFAKRFVTISVIRSAVKEAQQDRLQWPCSQSSTQR